MEQRALLSSLPSVRRNFQPIKKSYPKSRSVARDPYKLRLFSWVGSCAVDCLRRVRLTVLHQLKIILRACRFSFDCVCLHVNVPSSTCHPEGRATVLLQTSMRSEER